MDARVNNPVDSGIGDLFHQLVDDGRSVVKAEINLYKQIGLYRAGRAKSGVIAIVVAVFLANAALVAAFVGLVLGLANLIGPVAGGLVVLAATGILAFFLVRYGAGKMSALVGDPEEKAALAAGERQV